MDFVILCGDRSMGKSLTHLNLHLMGHSHIVAGAHVLVVDRNPHQCLSAEELLGEVLQERASKLLAQAPEVISNLNSALSDFRYARDIAEEALDPDYVAGSLRYLYRNVCKAWLPRVVRRYVLRQPCWRRNRWKSLT